MQSQNSYTAGVYVASNFNFTSGKVLTGAASGAATLILDVGYVTLADGTVLFPYATNAPLLVDIGTNQETVTPSAVTNATIPGVGQCQITATYSNAHGQGCIIASGTAGLQEAINAAKAAGGGVVVVDSSWSGTTTMLAAAVNGSTVAILDYRGGTIKTWTWNGTTFGISPQTGGAPTILYAANGAISVAPQTAILTKAGVDAMTLAAPTAAQAGTTIVITSRTANAHTVTATGLLNTGSASVNLATFAAFAGAGFTVVADNLKWNVISSTGITFS